MILSQPDFEHAKHLGRKQKIELAIKQRMADGEEPIKALKSVSKPFNIDTSSLHLLGKEKILKKKLKLETVSLNNTPYNALNEEVDSGTKFGFMTRIESELLINMYHQQNSRTAPSEH